MFVFEHILQQLQTFFPLVVWRATAGCGSSCADSGEVRKKQADHVWVWSAVHIADSLQTYPHRQFPFATSAHSTDPRETRISVHGSQVPQVSISRHLRIPHDKCWIHDMMNIGLHMLYVITIVCFILGASYVLGILWCAVEKIGFLSLVKRPTIQVQILRVLTDFLFVLLPVSLNKYDNIFIFFDWRDCLDFHNFLLSITDQTRESEEDNRKSLKKAMKRSFSLLKTSSDSGTVVPLHRIISLVSITSPRSFQPHKVSISPSFVEFDMTDSGYGYVFADIQYRFVSFKANSHRTDKRNKLQQTSLLEFVGSVCYPCWHWLEFVFTRLNMLIAIGSSIFSPVSES